MGQTQNLEIGVSTPKLPRCQLFMTHDSSICKSPYTWSVSCGGSYVSTSGGTSDTATVTGSAAGAAVVSVTDDNGKTMERRRRMLMLITILVMSAAMSHRRLVSNFKCVIL
jgi:hypothetical protein